MPECNESMYWHSNITRISQTYFGEQRFQRFRETSVESRQNMKIYIAHTSSFTKFHPFKFRVSKKKFTFKDEVVYTL